MVKTTQTRPSAFTLIELMTVAVIILVLAAILVGVAGYVQKKVAISATKTQIAAISAGLEMYKADWGYYPVTTPSRISANGMWESTNNCIVYHALCPTNPVAGLKTYMRFPAAQIRINPVTLLPNIYDSWGKPLNYYNSPGTTYQLITSPANYFGYTLGGQVNVSSYDLFSYGPDGYTYAMPNAALPAGWAVPNATWNKTNSANDDISAWGR